MERTKCDEVSGHPEGQPELSATKNQKLNYDGAMFSKRNRKDLCPSSRQTHMPPDELVPNSEMNGKLHRDMNHYPPHCLLKNPSNQINNKTL